MASSLENTIETLRGGVTESRFENVRYRQDQFHALHAALRENSDAIFQAIAKDSGASVAEAEAEFFLAMDAVQKSYDSLNFEKSLEQEYFVANGKNNTDRRTGVGLVAIRPQKHTKFYSVVSAISAALAAGNCILIELDLSSHSIDDLLKTVLVPVLDQDTFAITSSKIEDKNLSNIDIFIDQTASVKTSSPLHSSSELRTLAILDRTGSLEIAAKAITTSRLGTSSTSPYSPDLVIVNEYLAHNFGSACLQHASNIGQSTQIRNISPEEKALQKSLQKAQQKGQVKIHKSPASDLSVVEIVDPSSPLVTTKIIGPYILILPSTSLLDSVTTQRSSPTFLATYHFASPAAAKFLSEQIPSHASYVNQIPPQLLFGPPSPTPHTHALHPRYLPSMFSSPRPQFITASPTLPSSLEMKKSALKELKPTGQKPGHAIGFFEQGILIGLGGVAAVVLPVLGWGLVVGGRRVWGVLNGLR